MFQEHPSFIPPPDKTVKIWRYMDITKFLSLIENETIYFTKADKLGDPFEGSYTRQSLIDRKDGGKDYSKWYENLKTQMLINCWHVNEHESEAMWKLYLKSNEGIAIQSTYERLIKSVDKDKDYHTQVGLVNYLDYNKDTFEPSNTFNAFITKRKSFEHERELRAIIDLGTWNPGTKSHTETVEHGKHIPIHLDNLIENVYVAPYCDNWIFELVQSITKRLKLDFKFTRSTLNSRPLF